ncbi:hypothetical protein SVTN_25615 [Streptomyces vietnamensis]|uniref:FXSXX-COOH protein n=1 Tax=Streptomyces vietnamensis TaxID=362257 RepID=A0A0B5IC81_9ACTN|nr:hypothetical protein SVTN_25615 [Streptomyces vietnamensis]
MGDSFGEEEPRVCERTGWATGVGRDAVRSSRLSDLAAVDLRTLRVMDDAALGAAVERVLLRPSDLVESWQEDEFVG